MSNTCDSKYPRFEPKITPEMLAESDARIQKKLSKENTDVVYHKYMTAMYGGLTWRMQNEQRSSGAEAPARSKKVKQGSKRVERDEHSAVPERRRRAS